MNKELIREAKKYDKDGIKDDNDLFNTANILLAYYGWDQVYKTWQNARWLSKGHPGAYNLLSTSVWLGFKAGHKPN